ncbi:MAG: septum formation inhibitor Maf [Uliginosibacterium sp.]|jgi:septum formation protein|nr:septum formation inhibitor Maf [Uliginosibacterium sp.]MBK9394998.1 septum formation inhibitor Maf [Uliginosibacterium sp.]MBK9617453.1 septum formation inhibitor Maf [Uliginosibacterium sp.]
MHYSSHRIYLASRSPRRRELLHQIGVPFDTLLFRAPPREDEDVCEDVLPGEAVEAYVVRVARAKAQGGVERVAARRLQRQPVLSADTTLELDGTIIGKPESPAHAEDILSRLSGRDHQVLTAVALAHQDRVEHRLNQSVVHFRALSHTEIKRYVAGGEPMDKAGAYGIQGFAATFIADIKGSYTGIMGLPLFETAELLRHFKLLDN